MENYKEISNYISNELGFDRNEIEKIIQDKVDKINVMEMIKQSIDKYFGFGSNTGYGQKFIESKIQELIEKELKLKVKNEIGEYINKIIEFEIDNIMSKIKED